MLYQVASRLVAQVNGKQLVVSLTDEGIYGPRLRAAGVEVHCLGMRSGYFSPSALMRLVRLLRQQRPAVVMTWLYHADLIGTIAARIARVPRIVWNIRCSDIDFSRYSPVTHLVVSALARLSAMPEAIATNSIAGRRVHEQIGYRPRRWIYLPNGIDTNEWAPSPGDGAAVRAELGLPVDAIVIGMVARVDPQKDHTSFFEAARMLVGERPRLRIILVGRGTQEICVPPELRPVVHALGERSDVARLMRTFDLLVSSSAYGEGFPNVLGEALASGVFCVATDVGDTKEILADGGIVVPPRAPAALAEAIGRVIAMSPEEVRSLAAAARRRIELNYSLEACVDRYLELIRIGS